MSQTFPWDSTNPEHIVQGFLIVGGNVTVNLGYVLFPQGVLLFATTKIGAAPPELWRRYWTPRESAVKAAEDLAAWSETYITETLGLSVRPIEDLDLDDFIEHLRLRIENEFN